MLIALCDAPPAPMHPRVRIRMQYIRAVLRDHNLIHWPRVHFRIVRSIEQDDIVCLIYTAGISVLPRYDINTL